MLQLQTDDTGTQIVNIFSGEPWWQFSEIYHVLALSPNGQIIVFEQDNGLMIHNAIMGVRQALSANVNYRTLSFSDDSTLFTLSNDTGTHIWDVTSGILLQTIPESSDFIAISPDNTMLALANREQAYVRLWGISDNTMEEIIATLSHEMVAPHTFDFNTDGSLLAVGDTRFLHIWDTINFRWLYTLTEHQSQVTDVVFSHDGYLLLSADVSNTLYFWKHTPQR